MGQETASPYSAPNGATYSGPAGEKELGIVSFKGLEILHFVVGGGSPPFSL